MSVRLWNFNMVGPKIQDFCPRINIPKEFFLNNPVMNYGSSEIAKIVLSKSIFYVKNQRHFFKKKKEIKNINLGDHIF